MTDFLSQSYLWIKTAHIVAVIAWMAGMLYLPRLFVYHCEAAPGSEMSETFKVMERKLMRIIINPAMIATWIFGLLLLFVPGVVSWSAPWIYIKLTVVVGLTGVQHMLSRYRKAFEADRNTKPQRFYRILNEVPAVIMLVAVAMVVLKPGQVLWPL